VFGALEFAGNEAAVPDEDGIRFGDAGYLAEGSATEALADFSECRSLGIREAHACREVRPENPVFSDQISFWSRSF